ncbi:MAG TPA: hypothetical protein VIB79_12460, partial [Candidatus Binatia bacterium]
MMANSRWQIAYLGFGHQLCAICYLPTADLLGSLLSLCLLLFTPASPATAQQPVKLFRIGYLTVGSPATTPARYAAFRQGLRELGYTEGKNITIEYRY